MNCMVKLKQLQTLAFTDTKQKCTKDNTQYTTLHYTDMKLNLSKINATVSCFSAVCCIWIQWTPSFLQLLQFYRR